MTPTSETRAPEGARERPIIFSGSMVRAILAGRKTRKKLYVRKGEDHNSPEHLARRLANGLDAAPDQGCWIWRRTINRFGYGTLTINGRRHYAHRLAYELSVGPIPDGAHLLHSCDTPGCINPEHLTPGTRSANMLDAVRKGRLVPPRVALCGERNGAAKLTADEVRQIRICLERGERQQVVADRFRVSQTLISGIALRKVWK